MNFVGNGALAISSNSFCPDDSINYRESLQISGELLNADPGSCDEPRSSLTQSFLRHPHIKEFDQLELIGAIQ